MADILIRGMEMPEGDWEYVSLWLYGDGRVYVSNKASAAYSRRLQDLAVPLPEGHGRLIDANALIRAMFITSDGTIMRNANIDGWPFEMKYSDIKRHIRQAPTIIEADKEVFDNG